MKTGTEPTTKRNSALQRAVKSDIFRAIAVTLTAALLLYLVVVPLVFLIFGSVFTGRPGQEGEITAGVYREIIGDPRSYRLMWWSFVYGATSTSISVAIGLVIAWLVQRTDLPGKNLFAFLALLPLFVPTVLNTIGWILLLDGQIGVANTVIRGLLGMDPGVGPLNVYSFWGMVWVKGMLDIPLVVLWLWPAFAAMDPGLEEASAMSGASRGKVIGTVTLPLMRPALLAAFLISFVSSLEDVTVPILVGLPARINVFASEIYVQAARTPSDLHRASGYAAILLVITLALIVLYRRLTLKTERFVTVRGKGFRPSVVELGRSRWPVTIGLAALLFVIVILPMLLLLWVSLTPFMQAPSFAAFGTLTTEWYESVFIDARMRRGLVNSATLGLVTAVIVMLISLIVGWIVVRTRSRAAYVLDILAFTPIAVPGLVIGIALIWLYLTVDLPITVYGTSIILVLAYVTRFIPYGVRLSYAGFAQVHPELEEAAAVSGSSWAHVIRKISLPLLSRSMAVGAIYVFLRGFRELPASLLLHSIGQEPYSVVVFFLWTTGQTARTAAYGIVAIVFMTVVVAVLHKLGGRGGLLARDL